LALLMAGLIPIHACISHEMALYSDCFDNGFCGNGDADDGGAVNAWVG
jgi:hypothetical protein